MRFSPLTFYLCNASTRSISDHTSSHLLRITDGLTRAPFTSLILVLEMTDTQNVILVLMISAIIAQSAAKIVDPVSFYEHVSYRIIHGKAPQKGVVLHDSVEDEKKEDSHDN